MRTLGRDNDWGRMKTASVFFLFFSIAALANPYPRESEVPKDSPDLFFKRFQSPPATADEVSGIEVLRIDVSWEPGEAYTLTSLRREHSGTEALLARAEQRDTLGSFKGQLVEPFTQRILAEDSQGTGTMYRELTRGFSFRFPLPTTPVEFKLIAEHPTTGQMETVLSHHVDPEAASDALPLPQLLDVRPLKQASRQPELRVNLYAEGYLASRKDRFWQDAQKAVAALESNNFPGFDQMTFTAVFHPSEQKLGRAENLGLPVPERNSFLGLYFPYWMNFGRWYHVVYPTRVAKYRDGIGYVPYDYPLVLVDDSNYWGVGNFKEATAIPSQSWSFTYLLLHEMGHYFGLNEEYESGGATELSFAPEIAEPWSQNITFLRDVNELKWGAFVKTGTPIPTPSGQWSAGKYGAYKGGYAESPPKNTSHKPGLGCVMGSQGNFCAICRHAIEKRIAFDTGEKNLSKPE